jgi:hypothetical protein
MKSVNKLFGYFILLPVTFCLFAMGVSAQDKVKSRDFCSNDTYYNGDKVGFKELRESTVSAGSLTVDGKRNGGIKVRGENRSDILIRACIQTWDTTEEAAREIAKGIRVETGSVVRAEGAAEQSNSSVSYEILVPRSTNLKLTTHNGGIGIHGVDGTIEFEAHNGGVSLYDVAGDVKGKTRNGGVSVTLLGNTWKGSGLDVETTNGGVSLSLPETYAARIETGTVNGGFKSDFGALNVERNDRTRGVQINTELNGGGAPIRVITRNGGIKISSLNKVNL